MCGNGAMCRRRVGRPGRPFLAGEQLGPAWPALSPVLLPLAPERVRDMGRHHAAARGWPMLVNWSLMRSHCVATIPPRDALWLAAWYCWRADVDFFSIC